jgi:hypothetical protein
MIGSLKQIAAIRDGHVMQSFHMIIDHTTRTKAKQSISLLLGDCKREWVRLPACL